MSEIKGQILGVILVLMIFGAVAGAMTTVFSNLTGSVSEKTDAVTNKLELTSI